MLIRLWIEDAVFFLVLSIAAPGVAVAIGYAAWLGKPKDWDRSMYWTAFVVSALVSVLVMVWAQRMLVDLTSWWRLLQLSIFGLGALLFGVAGGCVLSVFTYGRGTGPFFAEQQVHPKIRVRMSKAIAIHPFSVPNRATLRPNSSN